MCYCGSAQPFDECCNRYIQGVDNAPCALTLMKSRYSAFCTQAIDYLCTTCSTKALLNNSRDEVAQFASAASFIKLEIVDSELVAIPAYVEFKAHYLHNNTLCCIHERSAFVKDQGSWRYDEGELFPVQEVKLNRNDPCPCDSGKKFKKCCAS